MRRSAPATRSGWISARATGTADPPLVVSRSDGRVAISAAPEGSADLLLRVADPALPIAQRTTVGIEQLASLEVAAAHQVGEVGPAGPGWGAPIALRAIVRDADGGLIHGAPVQWTLLGPVVRGGLSGDPEYLPGPDCLAVQADPAWLEGLPPGEHVAEAGACETIGRRTAWIDLSFTEVVPEPVEPVADDEDEEEAGRARGCGGPPAPPAPWELRLPLCFGSLPARRRLRP